MLDWLNNFILNTPTSIMIEKWANLDREFPSGVTAFDYLEISNENYLELFSPPDCKEDIIICKEMTSEFSGVFFFANLVGWKKSKTLLLT